MRSALFQRLIETRSWEEKEKRSGHRQELVMLFLLLDSDPEGTKKGREKVSRVWKHWACFQRRLFLNTKLPQGATRPMLVQKFIYKFELYSWWALTLPAFSATSGWFSHNQYTLIVVLIVCICSPVQNTILPEPTFLSKISLKQIDRG